MTSVQAVHISPNGTGQVLIFPYYTVRNGFATLVSVSNTQNNTKAVKVRFREGMNGREVTDFNLFLAPNDTWTGAVVETANGARIITNDNSCVAPSDYFTEVRKISATGQSFNEFINVRFTGSNQDNPAFSSLDRTREGFFEILEMGVIDAALSPTAAQIVGFVKPDVYTNRDANCAALDSFDSLAVNSSPIRFPNTAANLMAPPRGGLKGRASLINAASGANYSFSPTALDGWSSQVAYSAAGDARSPLLADAFPATSIVTTPAGIVMARWANGRDAVSASLMRESLMNEFVLDAGTASQTDWIVTLPTKLFYTDPVYGNTNSAVRAPFGGFFSAEATTGCDSYSPSATNREAQTGLSGIVGVRPPLPLGTGPPILCRTANLMAFLGSPAQGSFPGVIAFSSVLGSPTLTPLSFYGLYETVAVSTSTPASLTTPALRAPQGRNGRATLLFNQTQQQLTPLSAILISPSGAQTAIPGVHYGLPVIGLMLHNYQNANVVSRYGGVVEHAYSVRVE